MATNNSINSNDPIQVALGGTGNSSLTAHSVLVGEGTSAISPITVGTNGQVLIGATSADPAFAALTSTGGSFTYTTGTNSLNIDVSNWSDATSFTPTLNFGGSGTSLTYTTQTGYYTTIGKTVYFVIYLVINNKGSSTGNIAIVGPTITVNSSINASLSFAAFNITWSNQLQIYISPTTFLNIVISQVSSNTTETFLTNSNVSNGAAFYISGSFFTT